MKNKQQKSSSKVQNSYKPQKGLFFQRHYTSKGKSPFEQFNYVKRASTIQNQQGEQLFSMEEVEVPEHWSQLATDILAQKYFRKSGVPNDRGQNGQENSARQVVHRLAACWRHWGEQYGYFAGPDDAQVFYDELVYTLLGQYAAPNSPQWFNTGLHHTYGISGTGQGHYYVDPETKEVKESTSAYERPQVHACFILSVKDDLVNEGGIMDLWVKEARLFKFGSGAGTNFSAIRAKDEKLSGGGQSSGLMSFLKVGDRAAGAIKSGGTTRRAAKMVCLDIDHPEIEDFISWKQEEEKKVAALAAAGYSAEFEGEAYQTVSGQNSNNSVRVPNRFFRLLEEGKPWPLKERESGTARKAPAAAALWKRIAEATWGCGDPGLQFDTTINEWHTCPESGRINASNPCSEYMFLDNTACNLASVNLWKFWDTEKQEFDVEAFQHVCRLYTVVLEISVLMAQFPSAEIARLSYEYRTLGLGFSNLGGLLMRAGIPYDSEKGRGMAGAISALLTGTAYAASAEMAEVLGPFAGYEKNSVAMQRVLRNHRAAVNNWPEKYEVLETKPAGLDARHCPDYLHKAACQLWDKVLEQGEIHGFRNAQVSAVAPTGTIGLLMDCDTTGIEPDFSLIKYKKLSGGGSVKIASGAVQVALKSLGYSAEAIERIVQYMVGAGSFEHAPQINYASLRAKGFPKEALAKLEKAAPTAFDFESLFSVFVLGEACLQSLGFTAAEYRQPRFSLLRELGFSRKEIAACTHYVLGSLTVEGAPGLKEEHLPVFDCASRNGENGRRFLSPLSHIRMMAAVQPYISGAISKTINMPQEATVDDIQEMYKRCWELGLKSCAIYRDGSKSAQPLSKSNKKELQAETEEELQRLEKLNRTLSAELQEALHLAAAAGHKKKQVVAGAGRVPLPERRKGFTQKAKIDGQAIYVRTGEYPDGRLGEIFVDMYKEGVAFRSMLNCFAISVSIGLQYGVPLEAFAKKFVFTRFEPSGRVEHGHIKQTTSVPDFIFRLLSWEYLGREDLIHVKPGKEEAAEAALAEKELPEENPREQEVLLTLQENQRTNGAAKKQRLTDELSYIVGDSPLCDTCGHVTVRSGTCFKCLNCGNSLGCS